MGLVQAKIETAVETSSQLIESLHMAREVALKSNVAEVLPVHLVLAMLEDDESSFLLEAYGVDFNRIRSQLGKIVQQQVRPKTADRHAVFSPGIEMIMQHAREQAQKNALGEVDSNLILAVILSEPTGFLEKMLVPYDLDTSGVLQYLELREGKTVHMDPLPSLQHSAPQPAGNQAPRAAPAPAPLARAPLGNAPPAPGRLVPPASPAHAPHQPAPAPALAPTPVLAPSHLAASGNHRQPDRGPMPTPAVMPSAPQEIKMPAAQNVPSPRVDPAAGLKQALASARTLPASSPSIAARAPANDKRSASFAGSTASETTDQPADAPAASRFRSMIGKLGRVMSGNSGPENAHGETDQVSQEKPDASAALAVSTPARPPIDTPPPAQFSEPAANAPNAPVANLAATAANNNQGTPVASTNLLSTPQAVLSPADEARQAEARMNLHTNRRAKRRRAIPARPGANQSLSATGSVLEKGRLVENIPRRMKVNNSSKAEVRITRAQMEEINNEFDDLSLSHIHDLSVTEAMTVQLRAPGSGFHIENLSPQTQWIDRNQRHINDADFGIWRWNVTPTNSGKARLQLVISARTVDDEGTIHIADIPDKIIELSIYRDHTRIMKKAGLIALVAIMGVALGRFGETALQLISKMAAQLGS